MTLEEWDRHILRIKKGDYTRERDSDFLLHKWPLLRAEMVRLREAIVHHRKRTSALHFDTTFPRDCDRELYDALDAKGGNGG